MSGQISAMNAAQAAGNRAMKDQARVLERRWGGRWTVSTWPPRIDVDVNNPHYLGAWATLELDAAPPGRSYWVLMVIELVDDPTLLRLDAAIDRPSSVTCETERVAEIPARDVPLDEGPMVAIALVVEICKRLDELLVAGGEPLDEAKE